MQLPHRINMANLVADDSPEESRSLVQATSSATKETASSNDPPQSILEVLSGHVQTQGDATAFTFLKSDDERISITYRQLDERARSIASGLLNHAEPGDRALMMYPAGLEFIEAFLGCLYAGIIAVPAYPPKKNRNADRIRSIATDCSPRLLLCASATRESVESSFANTDPKATVIASDEFNSINIGSLPSIQSSQIAFLQYTSGSTSTPKGVCITHRNLVANETAIQDAFRHDRDSVVFGWLPAFHDMGLIGLVLQPLFAGIPSILMSPIQFLYKPVRWFEAISEFKVTSSGGPNFGYDQCLNLIQPLELKGIDLSSWRVAFNGAEPIRKDTLDRFAERYGDIGFSKSAFFPCYGMAETTLLVSGSTNLHGPTEVTLRDEALTLQPKLYTSQQHPIVSCGKVTPHLEVKIIDPKNLSLRDDHEVREIWVRGSSVALGYWNRQVTKNDFDARYSGQNDNRPYFRTGDLGFLLDSELYVTGRLKDLIIIRGRNIYPQDIELLVEQNIDSVEYNSCAAFSVDCNGEERIVVAAEGTREMLRWFKRDGDSELVGNVLGQIEKLRQAVVEKWDVALHDFAFLLPNTFPRTSSGKVQRHLAKERVLSKDRCFKAFPKPTYDIDDLLSTNDFGKQNDRTAFDLSSSAYVQECEPRHSSTLVRSVNLKTQTHSIVRSIVVDWLRTELDANALDVDDDRRFGAMGVDSVAAVSLTVALEKAFSCSLPDGLLFQHRTIRELVDYLESEVTPQDEFKIRKVNTPDEREAVYRFRYSVYVEEMNRPQKYADHASRKITDPLDEQGDIFAVFEGPRVVGTVRVNLLRRDPLDEYRNIYGISELTEDELNVSSISTRIMLAPHVRQSPIAGKLLMAAFEFGRSMGVQYDYCDCNDPVLDFFKRVGYQFQRRVHQPEYGDVSVMRLDLADIDYLRSVGSPLVASGEFLNPL